LTKYDCEDIIISGGRVVVILNETLTSAIAMHGRKAFHAGSSDKLKEILLDLSLERKYIIQIRSIIEIGKLDIFVMKIN
jgi:hypothetical protein